MNRSAIAFGLCIAAVAVGALAFRLPRLTMRPMHPDEANQAVRTGILYDTGVYRYDPSQHHGPSLYYLSLAPLAASGARDFAASDEFDYRIVPAVFGAGLVLLLLLIADGIGRTAAVAAGILTAVSSAMVFYSRYYIQEMTLVFFTFAAIVLAWRYVETRSIVWAVAAGAAVGLMHATKETWVLAAGAAAAAIVLAAAWTRLRDGKAIEIRPLLGARAIIAGAAAAVLVAAALYSSFGANLQGPLDSVLAFGNYVTRAGAGEGELHSHPWHSYLLTLIYDRRGPGIVWTEGLIVGLAAVGIVAALARKGGADGRATLLRFLAFYTVILTAVYAAIPYKTPWCMLSFLHGMILMAGVGAAAVIGWMPRFWGKAAACIVLGLLAAHLGWQAYRLNYRFYADERNPYNYAYASSDVQNLARLMERLAESSPDGRNLLIKVISPENYWPLPWYLRRFNPDRVGYYEEAPADPDATVVIMSPTVQAEVEARLKGRYNKQAAFGLRPGVLLLVYVDDALWEKFVARQAAASGLRHE